MIADALAFPGVPLPANWRVSRPITASGALFHAFTAHHPTAVLPAVLASG